MKTTLRQIRGSHPCRDGWEKLLRRLGKHGPDNEPMSIITVLDSNGLDDALWCLRAVEGHDREIRLYAVWLARRVEELMHDRWAVTAVNVSELYANHQCSLTELDKAWNWAYEAYKTAGLASSESERYCYQLNESRRQAALAAVRCAAENVAYNVLQIANSAANAVYYSHWDTLTGAQAHASMDAEVAAQTLRLREICAEINLPKATS